MQRTQTISPQAKTVLRRQTPVRRLPERKEDMKSKEAGRLKIALENRECPPPQAYKRAFVILLTVALLGWQAQSARPQSGQSQSGQSQSSQATPVLEGL